MNKVAKIIEFIFKALCSMFFLLMIYYFSTIKEGNGDEQLFINDLQLINSVGWYNAISQKIGLTYLIIVYPFTFIFKNYIALRLVNVLLFIFLLIYFRQLGAIKNNMFYYYFLFFAGSGWFMLGTNDTLFFVSLVIFFNEVYKILEEKNKVNTVFLFSSLIITFFTRQLVYLYLPVIFISFYFIFRKKIEFLKLIKVPIILFFFMLLINIPSLVKNHNFSYDNKLPPSTVKSNWAQRQYLAQLMVNNGQLANYQHPTWQQTDDYLIKNGKKSLPNGIIPGMIFDYKLTIKEFFKDFLFVITRSIRQTGIIIHLVLLFLVCSVYKKNITTNLYIPFVLLFMTALFSFIIISYVELRWLVPVYIMTFVFYSDLETDKKLHRSLPVLVNLVFISIIFYGTFRVLSKL